MIEIYCGDGKGKTTAAVGLTLRAVGNGIPVLFIQFMKDGSSGEIKMLKEIKNVTVHYPRTFYGFTSAMNEQQKEEMKEQYMEFLGLVEKVFREQKGMQANEYSQGQEHLQARGQAPMQEQVQMKLDITAGTDIRLVVVLDEVIHACNKNLLEGEALLKLIEECPDDTELILTGRNPSESLLEKADYISEIKKCRHPFDQGVPARKGIER